MVMNDRNEAGTEGARTQPGVPNPEDEFEQGRMEAHRQAAEESAALARAHYEVEPGLRAIYRLESADPNDHRIKLLEVNKQTVPTGIMPVSFPAHPASGRHYPSVVIEVTHRSTKPSSASN